MTVDLLAYSPYTDFEFKINEYLTHRIKHGYPTSIQHFPLASTADAVAVDANGNCERCMLR